MSDIVKEVGTIWSRLFDHKAFLNGEIRFTLQEFETIRGDQEVQNLFALLEKITDIKGTQIPRIKQLSESTLSQTVEVLNNSLDICDKINALEEKYKNDIALELCRENRNTEWEKFVDDISFTCKRLDNTFEEKEEELQEFYRDLEKKLYIRNSV
ncbi:biogenesis of lysosome-related organelles complex 1 subunit 5 [Onthophagus taurus]|uniref:biogenesis of lysosome-related organelles complex 1 subunit 5 n=1 Tax=Onthophagus taurus TaxID=166361 RepID=UPI000C201451|nr:biogenesis of lysosome-related organelles complex 1 subunit 5-like isoform X2 [Onthophagus taurus]